MESIDKGVLRAGTPTFVSSTSGSAPFGTFFEDDGETGYFYAMDQAGEEGKILDAVLIYNVASVADRDEPSQIAIIWSTDGLKSALLINDYPHAVFDFQVRRGYSRSNFPNFPDDPARAWHTASHEWRDEVTDFLARP